MNNYILQNENAVYYECGYSCDNEIFLNLGDEKFFITDSRYEIEANEFLRDVTLIISSDLIDDCKKILKAKDIKELVIDGNDMSYFSFLKLSVDSNIKFINEPNFSQIKRAIKTDEELKILKEATNLNKQKFEIFKEFLNNSAIGLSEFEIYQSAKEILSENFKYDFAFDPIIALNANAAKAHARPSDVVAKKNDLILFDAGVKFKKYCSDRTRVARVGDANFIDPKFNSELAEVYEIVKNAKEEAIKFIKPGVLACDIDKVARDYITKFGYGEYFTHSTGHGVGLDIHEYPFINKASKMKIQKNMIFSVEPGIYIKNKFGIRLEDLVVVTEDGCEIL